MGQEAPHPSVQHLHAVEFNGVPVFFQIIVLEKQIFVWIGSSEASLGNMSISVPQSTVGPPAVTSILRWNPQSAEQMMSTRLAKKIGRSVALSHNLPETEPALLAFAEKKAVELVAEACASCQ